MRGILFAAPISLLLWGVLFLVVDRAQVDPNTCTLAYLSPLPDSLGFHMEPLEFTAHGPDGRQIAAYVRVARPDSTRLIIEARGECGGTVTDTLTVPPWAGFTLPNGSILVPRSSARFDMPIG